MPKVSVIIPNYQHAPYLHWRVDTVLNQNFRDFEVLIMDDCSADNSQEIIEQYRSRPGVRILYNDKNSGSVFKQWQKGIDETDSDYVWIAESDDWADPRFLSTLVPVMDANRNVSVAYTQSWLTNKAFEVTGNAICWTEDLDSSRWRSNYLESGMIELKNYLSKKNTIPNASAALQRRSSLLACTPIQSDFRLCGDWIHWIRMAAAGDIYFHAEPMNFWRLESSNARTRKPGILEWDEGLRIFKQLGAILEWNEAEQIKQEYEQLKRCFNWLRESVNQ